MNLFLSILINVSLCACTKNQPQVAELNIKNIDSMKLKISVGKKVFTATLYNNTTTIAFKKKLPLTINMTELNGNEKYYYFSSTLPTNASDIGSIQAGDLMLYGNNCLVLFYETFNTTYKYTRLGRIDDGSQLASTLGKESVTVKFELE